LKIDVDIPVSLAEDLSVKTGDERIGEDQLVGGALAQREGSLLDLEGAHGIRALYDDQSKHGGFLSPPPMGFFLYPA